MPNGWSLCRIGDVCSFENGYAFSSHDYKESGVPLIRISNIVDNQINIEQCVYIQGPVNERFIVKKGDLLIALSGATTGKMGVYNLDTKAYLNQRVGNLRIKHHELIISEFRDYVMMAKSEEILKLAYGGAQPNISGAVICEMELLLPPLSEQIRIINELKQWLSIINSLDNGKENLRAIINQAKIKILDIAVHGKLVPQDLNDEPASELLKRINPKAEITCDNAHYPQLPRGWAICHLEDVIEYEQPTAYIVSSTNYSDSYPTPVLTAGKSFIIGFTDETAGVYNKLPCIIFDDFTTDSKYVDFPFKVKSSAMKILQVHEGLNIEYVSFFMSVTRLIGDTHKRYWISEYSKLPIPLPPRNEQDPIVASIKSLYTLLDTIKEGL